MPLSPSVVELPGPWTHEYLHTRGIRLHAAVAGSPDDPLIVCLHGSVGGWFDYQDALPQLAAAGFHVAALDLRGYGLSDKPPVEMGQDIRTLIGDVVGAIQALGHDTAYLVGNDTAAGLAWAVACERPERVAGVVSISGAHPVDLRRSIAARPWDFGWILLRTVGARLPMPLLQRLPKESLVATDVRLNVARRSAPVARLLELRQQAIQIGNTYRGLVWNHRLLTAPLPRAGAHAQVEAPVLFLHANQGLWGPVLKRARRRAGRLRALHLPGTKNLPHVEDATGFAAAVTTWARHP